MFWMLYAFFWVIPRRLNFICRFFRTLCLFHLHRWTGMKNSSRLLAYEDGTDSVLKCLHTKFRHWRITQKKAYNITHFLASTLYCHYTIKMISGWISVAYLDRWVVERPSLLSVGTQPHVAHAVHTPGHSWTLLGHPLLCLGLTRGDVGPLSSQDLHIQYLHKWYKYLMCKNLSVRSWLK